MKRNTALFGASLVAGVAAASGLIMTSGTSSAAGTYYGATWADPAQGTSGGWADGTYGDATSGSFWGTAAAGKGTFQTVIGDQVTISVACDGDAAVTTVVGGGAAGTYHEGDKVSLDKFVNGGGNVEGTVYFGKTVAGHTAGAYIDMPAFAPGTFAAVGGADCAAPTSTSTTNPPTSTTTNPPTSTTTNPPTSTTTNPPTSTGTNPPSSTTTNPPTSTPPTTPPPTTEPPTPTPTTTTLPVTG